MLRLRLSAAKLEGMETKVAQAMATAQARKVKETILVRCEELVGLTEQLSKSNTGSNEWHNLFQKRYGQQESLADPLRELADLRVGSEVLDLFARFNYDEKGDRSYEHRPLATFLIPRLRENGMEGTLVEIARLFPAYRKSALMQVREDSLIKLVNEDIDIDVKKAASEELDALTKVDSRNCRNWVSRVTGRINHDTLIRVMVDHLNEAEAGSDRGKHMSYYRCFDDLPLNILIEIGLAHSQELVSSTRATLAHYLLFNSFLNVGRVDTPRSADLDKILHLMELSENAASFEVRKNANDKLDALALPFAIEDNPMIFAVLPDRKTRITAMEKLGSVDLVRLAFGWDADVSGDALIILTVKVLEKSIESEEIGVRPSLEERVVQYFLPELIRQ